MSITLEDLFELFWEDYQEIAIYSIEKDREIYRGQIGDYDGANYKIRSIDCLPFQGDMDVDDMMENASSTVCLTINV